MKIKSHDFESVLNRLVLLTLLCIFLLFTGCGGGGGGGGSSGASNNPPTANADAPSPADEFAQVVLNGTGSTDGDGTIASYFWTQVSGDAAIITDANAAIAQFTAPLISADPQLTFRLTVTDDDGATDSDDVTVMVESAGFLSASAEAPPTRVNLSTVDWLHRGLTVAGDINRKSGVTEQISDVSKVGNPPDPSRFANSPIAYSWDDGAPTSPIIDTNTGIFYLMPNTDNSDVGKGYSLTVDADTTPKTLYVYLGVFQGEGKLVASLNDASAPNAELFISNEFGATNQVVAITFKTETASQSLNVEFTLNNDFATPSNVNFQAAVLEWVAKPTISPPGGVFTDSVAVTLTTDTPTAEIRYTLDNTEPDINSTLFTGPFTLTSTGDTLVRAKAFLDGNASPEESANFTINAGTGGSLSAFVDLPPASVDLTSQGSQDWLHRGLTAVGDINRKSGVTPPPPISDVSKVGNPTLPPDPGRFANSPIAYSWTDGIPTNPIPNTTTGIFFLMPNTDNSDVGKGYSLTVDADTTPKTLYVYLGVFQGEGKLVASLSDVSAPDAELFISNEFGASNRVVSITFNAASAPESLVVEFIQNEDFGTMSNVNFQAATLN